MISRRISNPGLSLLGLFVWLATSCFAQVEARVYATLEESQAALVIGDLKGLIAGAGTAVDWAAPGMGGSLSAQAGGFLGDPELEGLAEGAGIVAIAFPGNLVVVFAEVSEAQRDQYKENAAGVGLQAEIVGDLLVLSPGEEGIETGKKVAGEVQETLLAEEGKVSLEVFLHIPKILANYKAEIDAGIQQLPELMKAGMAEAASPDADTKGLANLVLAEIMTVYNLVSQLDIFRLELAPGEKGVSLDLSFHPQKDTNLSRLLTESKGGEAGNLIGMLPDDGAVRVEAAYDVDTFGDFAMAEIDRVFDALEMSEEEKTNLRKWVEDTIQIYGSGFAGSMFGESKELFSGALIYKVEDADQALKVFREMNASMESFGVLDLYKNLGMEMKFEYKENFKTHKGIPIHRMEMGFDFEELREKGAETFLKSLSNLTYELAIVKGFLLYTMGDAPIEAVIDRVLEGGAGGAPPLVSKEELGPEGSLYVDFSVEGYLRMIAKVVKDLPEDKASPDPFRTAIESGLSTLSGAPPILMGLFADTEQATFKIQVPAGLIQKGSQAALGSIAPNQN